MKIYRYIVAAAAFIVSCVTLSAQFTDSLAQRRGSSFDGYDFLVGYMQNENFVQSSGLRLRLVIATNLPARVTVQFPNGSATPYVISRNSTLTVVVPSVLEMRESEVAKSNLVRVTSDVPVAVYAMNSQYTTSDSYAVIPVSNWGNAYTVLSMPNDAYGFASDTSYVPPSEIRQSEFLVMASEDNTNVDLILSAPSEGGIPAGVARRVVLQKGECYLVKSAPIVPKQGDLTGSFVRANKPIAVVSGHSRTSVPQGLVSSVDSKDHLAEWLMPDQTLGPEYITTPFYTDARIPAGDIIRIVATQPSTRVSVYTERQDYLFTLNNPGDVQTISGVTSPAWIRADKAVTVGQYMLTGSVGGSSGYDPALTIIAPADKFITRSVFQAPFNLGEPAFATQFQKHFLNLVCDSLARMSLRLDGVNISKSIAPEILTAKFRSSPFFWAVIPITPGKHELSCDTGFFSGTLYGMGYTDSYAHTLGFATITGKSDSVAPSFTVSNTCGTLSGTVRETVNAVSTGIASVVIDGDSTKNYDFLATRVPDDINTVTWTAKPTDPYKDAQIFVITRDRAGNGRVFRWYYRAPRFTQTSSIQFTAKTENDSLCQRLFIQNPSVNDTLVIYSARLVSGGKVFVLRSPIGFPARVPYKTGIDFSVCFVPAGQSGLKATDTVEFDIGCGLRIRVPLRGTTPTSAIRVDDIDFGNVLVGDTACMMMRVINSGTRAATITQAALDFPSSSFFTDAQALLPKQLQPGDSMFLKVCFVPSDTVAFKRAMVYDNSLGLDVRGDVVAKGVRPILRYDSLDYGSLRIATFKDSLLVLRNEGNAVLNMQYQGQSGDNAEVLHSLPVGKSVSIAARDSFALPIRFYPLAVGSYRSVLQFTTSSKTYPQIQAVVRGNGTVPVIDARDVRFDTINVGASSSQRSAVAMSKGSEMLTIDTIEIQGPDAASFQIDSKQLAYRQVKVGDSVALTIAFMPKRKGRHDVTLLIRHDADKAYFRKESSIRVVGWARDTSGTVDTTGDDTTTVTPRRPAIRISTRFLNSCDTLRHAIEIDNNDTVALYLRDVRVISSMGVGSDVKQTLNRAVPAGRRDTVRGVVAPSLGNGTLRWVLNTTAGVIDTTLQVRVPRPAASIASVSPVTAVPGDTLTLLLSGTMQMAKGIPFTPQVSLSLPSTMVEVLQTQISLRLKTTGRTVAMNVDRQPYDVRLIAQAPIALDVDETWTAELRCRALLSQQQQADVDMTLDMGDACYDDANNRLALIIAPVCADDVRRFTLYGAAIRAAFPVPASDELKLDVESFMNDEFISVEAVDVLGRKIVLAEKLFLRKGLNSLIFDTHSLPSGLHRIELRSRDIETQIPIMFFK